MSIHSDPDPFAYDTRDLEFGLPDTAAETELHALIIEIQDMLSSKIPVLQVVASYKADGTKLTITVSVFNGEALTDSEWAMVGAETTDLVKSAFNPGQTSA